MYYSMDAIALQKWFGTSPCNAYTQSPSGTPCVICTRTHGQIRAWDVLEPENWIWEYTLPTSLISCTPDRIVPDYLLHGNRNFLTRTLHGSINYLKSCGCLRQVTNILHTIHMHFDPRYTPPGPLTWVAAEAWVRHKGYQLVDWFPYTGSEVNCIPYEGDELHLSPIATVFLHHFNRLGGGGKSWGT